MKGGPPRGLPAAAIKKMLLMNGNQIPDPHEMSVTCLPKEGGGIRRELRLGWADLPPTAAVAILAPMAAPVSLTFTDPASASRQTLPMALASALIEVAREDGDGARYRLVRLTLTEA